MISTDPIVASATPLGEGAIAIVRLSGDDVGRLVDGFFTPTSYPSLSDAPVRQLVLGTIAVGQEVIDSCMAVRFKRAKSYTGEDSVEFHLHGNPLIVNRVLQLSVKAGARYAEPGEFTRRAFLNGKIDLTQAEALADVIASESEQALNLAQRQLGGELRKRFEEFRAKLVELLAMLELELDFVEEGYEFIPVEKVKKLVEELHTYVGGLISSYDSGEQLRRGPKILLVGKPNAGKSSLFNAFLGYSRALVSPIAGTTRDYLEERLAYRGIVFHFLDTAGLRSTDDQIEAEGVERSRTFIPLSDYVLYLIDSSDTEEVEGLMNEVRELEGAFPDVRFLPVYTKADLSSDTDQGVRTSIYDRSSVIALLDKLVDTFSVQSTSRLALLSQRQYAILDEMSRILKDIQIEDSVSTELLSADLRSLLIPLSDLTGETTNEDVLNSIFSSFCIGK